MIKKKNIMQSYLKYKAYYDRKANASPLQVDDHCFILNPKADTQATKIPFREFQWIGPYKCQSIAEQQLCCTQSRNESYTSVTQNETTKI